MSYIPLPYVKLSRSWRTQFHWSKKTHLRGHSHVTPKRVSLDLPRDISEKGAMRDRFLIRLHHLRYGLKETMIVRRKGTINGEKRDPYLLHVKDTLVDFDKEQANATTRQHSHPQSEKGLI